MSIKQIKPIKVQKDDYDEIAPRMRKVRTDVLTVIMSIYAKKSSKNHKLKFKPEKRDKTKTKEAKQITKARKYDRICAL